MAEVYDPQAQAEQDAFNDINPRLFGGSQKQDMLASIQKNLAALNDQQSSPWPNILAIGALLTGNVGPMMQLQEQKRRTAFAQAFAPIQAQVSDLTNQGKWEDALDVMQQAGAAAGARVPEMKDFFMQATNRIAKKQEEFQNMKNVYEHFNDVAQMAKEQGKQVPPQAELLLRSLGRAAKERTPMSSALLQDMINRTAPHVQFTEGQALSMEPQTGTVTSQALPNVVKHSDVNDEIGNLVAGRTGLEHTGQLADVLNGRTITLANGQTIEPGSPEAQKIIAAHQASMPMRTQLAFAKLAPNEPAINAQLKAQGLSLADIAMGNMSQEQMQSAIQADQRRKVEVAIGPKQFEIWHNPMFAASNGLQPVDFSSGANFGNPITNLQTLSQAMQSGKNIGYMRPQDVQEKLQPTLQAIRGLDHITDFAQFLDNPKTLYDRAASGISRYASDLLGTAVGKNVEMAKAAEVFVRRSIEEVEKTAGIKDPEIGRLKEYIVGRFSNPAEALRTASYVQQRLQERLTGITGQQAPATPAQQQQGRQQFQPSSPTSTYIPKGGKPVKGDVEGALQQYGVQQQQPVQQPPQAPVTQQPRLKLGW